MNDWLISAPLWLIATYGAYWGIRNWNTPLYDDDPAGGQR